MLTKSWKIADRIPAEVDAALSLHSPIMRQLLWNRGISTEQAAIAFLRGQYDLSTDSLLMTDMGIAVERILRAIVNQESIIIYGDYDVDGVTATALLLQVLRGMDADAKPYIPLRHDEGYGLNADALRLLKGDGVGLVVTVDCGIRSPAEAEEARRIGLDLIITDHHHPKDDELPKALAVLNPKRVGDAYPDKDLAGVGVAFKLAQALVRARQDGSDPANVLDLVALGTIADMAPLTGENRMLVKQGLLALRSTNRQGFFALSNASGAGLARTTAGQIGFVYGPRLNASGRLESAMASLELLTTTDPFVAGSLAQQLEVQNRKRQELTLSTQELAISLATVETTQPFFLFAASPEFNSGVVGLAASKLTEAYYRPSAVAAIGPEETRGSCRSIPEFHITEALDECRDLLVRYGGHAAAAGFTVRNENLSTLRERLQEIARARLGNTELRPTLHADAEIKLSDASFDLLRELDALEPTGQGNPQAVFVTRSAKVRSAKAIGQDGKHLKLVLEDERRATLDAIAFRMGDLAKTLGERVDIAYGLELNEFNGRKSLQLTVKDIQTAQAVVQIPPIPSGF